MRPTDQPPPRPRPASIAANGGITAATTLIPTATGMDQKRTTFHARTMRATHVPMSQKYVALAPGRFTVAPHGRCDAGASRGFR